MNNPWYGRINGQAAQMPQRGSAMPSPQMNQQNLMGAIANAMRNPQAFAMQAFPDVPKEMWNNPAQALQYIQQTRNISQADIQNMIGSLPLPRF
jgi:hypothetical protein